MLTYRGDKFVKGKRFKINESFYRFQKRDNKDNLIFEDESGMRIKLTESEFNKNTLKEGEKVEANTNDIRSAIQDVANDFGVDFNGKVPFEYFYAPDSSTEDNEDSESFYSEDYDWADFYNKILIKLGIGDSPVLSDLRAEVHEISDGEYEMDLTPRSGKTDSISLNAWDTLDIVEENVEDIINILNSSKVNESLSFEEESDKIIDFDEAVRGYIEFELGMDDMDPETAKYLKSLTDEDIRKIARRVLNDVDEGLNEIVNYHLYDYKKEK